MNPLKEAARLARESMPILMSAVKTQQTIPTPPRVAYVGTVDCPTPACGFEPGKGQGQADVVDIGHRRILLCPRCAAMRGVSSVRATVRTIEPDIPPEPKVFKRIGA